MPNYGAKFKFNAILKCFKLHVFGEKIMFKDDKFIWWEKSCYTIFFSKSSNIESC